jgi:hypothetical protein
MRANGRAGSRIDVVRMSDGGPRTIDNTRAAASGHAGIDPQAVIPPARRAAAGPDADRQSTTPKAVPSTRGGAISPRIGKRAAAYRTTYPMGPAWTGWELTRG